MLWQENNNQETHLVPDDVLDISFRIQCPELPVDHAWHLYGAIREQLPWIEDDPRFGIHSIHGAASGNGWIRPPAANSRLQLSKRTRLNLRITKDRISDTETLSGCLLDIPGFPMKVGPSKRKPLVSSDTIFSRSVINLGDETELDLTQRLSRHFRRNDIRIKKMLCGLSHCIATPTEKISARSVLLSDLQPDESIYLQQHGFGEGRQLGCGIFIPHKSLSVVGSGQYQTGV